MKNEASKLTGVERTFHENEIIVSKTDLNGKLIYANDMFLSIADFKEKDVIGKPHNILRHPGMPRCVFKLLWDIIQSKNELFAYVINRTKYGDHYWVYAHVTPTFDVDRNVLGYHSTRRVASNQALDVIKPLYTQLCTAENESVKRKSGLERSSEILADFLSAKGVRYDEFVLQL